MKNKLKQFLRVAAALALVVSFVRPEQVAAENANGAPLNATTGGILENLDFYGVKPCRINASTTAVLCKSGEGFLDAVCAFNGLASGYTLALDSGVAGSRSVTNSDSLILSPTVFAKPDSASMVGGKQCWAAKDMAGGPVKFVNGLVGVQSAAAGTTLLYWHYSDGSNP